jgi:PEP-CTERM motif
MKKLALLFLALFALPFIQTARADSSSCGTTGTTISCTGNLSAPESVFMETFTSGGTTLDIQTFSYGGGTNAAGMVIPAGSFMPLIALYTSTGAIVPVDYVLDVTGTQVVSDTYNPLGTNPAASADSLVYVSPPLTPLTGASLSGLCPPGNIVGGQCGDSTLNITGLPIGSYTLVLTDAFNQPFSVNPGPPTSVNLSDGFADLTGGSFTFCASTSNPPCGNFAVDISPVVATVVTPEPTTLLLFGSGLLVVSWRSRKRASRTVVMKNKS